MRGCCQIIPWTRFLLQLYQGDVDELVDVVLEEASLAKLLALLKSYHIVDGHVVQEEYREDPWLLVELPFTKVASSVLVLSCTW